MEVLVDTSVWIQHFRGVMPDLAALLGDGRVSTHSVVIGELAVGSLRDRAQTLTELRALPAIIEARSAYSLDFIERHQLFSIGLSWGDVQILAAADLNGIRLWTLDQRLHLQALAFNLAWTP